MIKNHQRVAATFRSSLLATGFAVAALPVHSTELPRYSAWSAPVNLGPVINTAANESCDAISKDGLTLYFARGGNEIWFSERASVDAPWDAPQRQGPAINLAGSANYCPTPAADGHRLFFVSDRPGGCGDADIYVSFRRDTRDNLGWETPVNLGCQVNSPQADLRPSPFEGEDGTMYLYFSSARPGGPGAAGTTDIYVSVMQPDGKYGPGVLVNGLNTTFNDSRPNVRESDGLEIFFDSNRTGTGAVGGADLWTSTRASLAAPWSGPVNLGPVVNSSVSDQRPSLSWDGTMLYFQSNRPGGFGGTDIWVTTRTRLMTNYGISAAVTYRNPYSGQAGTATPIFLNDEFAYFYFFSPKNPEVFVKALAGNSPDFIQLFVGGTTDFEYKVTFLGCGVPLVYSKPPFTTDGYVNPTAIPKSACPQ